MPETSVDELTPVIVGVGQLLDRPHEVQSSMEPMALIMKALEIADHDSHHQFLKKTDSLDIQNITSWSYNDPIKMLTERLAIQPTHCEYHDVSGEMPIRSLCEAANRIATGVSKVAVICGGESAWSVYQARKNQLSLDSWSGTWKSTKSWIPDVEEIVRKYELHLPVRAYALYENACRAKWKQMFWDGQIESGRLQVRAAEIALQNEFSWTKSKKSLDNIINPSKKNRIIAWPYTRLMVANNTLNNGTAIILTNLRLALESGIDKNKLIYIHAGGYASEPDNIFLRDCYTHSSAMQVVFDRILSTNNLTLNDIDYTEIYSCFPIVTKLAKRIIHPDESKDLTIVGGMTFCRGQLSNFMSQVIVEMVKKLRAKGKYGLLYGNGHYLTHAAGVILSTVKPISSLLPVNLDLQYSANQMMGEIPDFIDEYEGQGTIETYTVVYNKDGLALFAIIIARTPEQKRFVAMTTEMKGSGCTPLLDTTREMIGVSGKSNKVGGYNVWIW